MRKRVLIIAAIVAITLARMFVFILDAFAGEAEVSPPSEISRVDFEREPPDGLYVALTKEGSEPTKFFRVGEIDESSGNPSLIGIVLTNGIWFRLISLPWDGQKREVKIIKNVEYHIFHQPADSVVWFAMSELRAQDFALYELIARRARAISINNEQ